MSDCTFKIEIFTTSSEQYPLIASKSAFLLSFQVRQDLTLTFSIEVSHESWADSPSIITNHFILLLTFFLHIYAQMQVEIEAPGEQEEKHEKEETPETDLDSSRAPEAPEFPSAEDHGKDSPLEVHGDQAHPGSSTAGLEQHEERREQEEETHEKPAGEPHPSVSTDGKGIESFQDSSEHHEAPKSQEAPDTDTSKEPEHKEPAVNGEIQVMAGSGEAAEEITQPEEPVLDKSPPSEVQSQELEVPDIKQEHTE